MKRELTVLALLCAALALVFVPKAAQADQHPNATIFVCPATIAIGATGLPPAAGWTSLSNTSSTFRKAEVVESVGLASPELTCDYATGLGEAGGRLGRPEPAGMLCTVNTVKPSQFDCFPRPGTAPPPSLPGTH